MSAVQEAPAADDVRVRVRVTDEDGVAGPARVVALPAHLGRDPQRVDVEIPDRMVSRRHARLESDGDRLVVVDLDSGNGTWVGGEQVTRRVLADREVITLGTSTLAWTRIPPAPAVAPKPTPPRRDAGTGNASGRAPSFGTAWAVALDEGRLRPMPLRGLYAAWEQSTRSLVALGALLADEDADAVARLDAHESVNVVTDDLMDGTLSRLGTLTLAFCRPDRPVDGFSSRLPKMRRLADHRRARAGVDALRRRLAHPEVDPVLRLLATEDRRLVERLGTAMRAGEAAFAEHGAAVIEIAGDELLDTLKTLFVALIERDRQVAAHLRVAGLDAGPDALPTPGVPS